MATIQRFEEIRAWQAAREITRRVHQTSNRGAFARDYRLRNQIQRGAVPIMSNVAEGFESDTQQQFIRFLGHAKTPAGEARAQLYVALDVGCVEADEVKVLFELTETCSPQLSAFMAYLKGNPGCQIGETGPEYEIGPGEDEPSNVQTFKPSNEVL